MPPFKNARQSLKAGAWFDAPTISIYYCAVMSDRLPTYIEPIQLADKRGELSGLLPLKNLDRLSDLLLSDEGAVEVRLFFSREGRIPKVEGHLKANLQLQCQTCLQAVEWPVDIQIRLGIVTTIEQANRLPEDYEPLMVEEERLLLKDIVEDEVLLAIPTFPRHQHDCFTKKTGVNGLDSFEKVVESPNTNPFSILAKLKKTGDL